MAKKPARKTKTTTASGARSRSGAGAPSRAKATRSRTTGKSAKRGAATTRTATRSGAGKRKVASKGVLARVKKELGAATGTLRKSASRAVNATRRTLDQGAAMLEGRKVKNAEDKLRAGFAEVKSGLKSASRKLKSAAAGVREDPRYKRAEDRALSGLHGVTSSLRGLVERVEENLDEIRAHATGEVVGGGRYDCRSCGKSVILTTRQELPACAGCGGRWFRLAS